MESTSILVSSLILVTTIGIAFFVSSLLFSDLHGLGYWGAGLILLGIGLFLYVCQYNMEIGWYTLLAYSLIFAGNGSICIGSRKFLKDKTAAIFFTVVFADACLAMAYFIFENDNAMARVLIVSVVIALLNTDTCIRFSLAAVKRKDWLLISVAGFHGILAGLFVVRAVYGLMPNGISLLPLLEGHHALNAFIVVSVSVITVLAVCGYVLLVKQYDHELRRKMRRIARAL